jgi:hypothetical protein
MVEKLSLLEVENGIRELRDVKTYIDAVASDTSRDWHAWNEVFATATGVMLQYSTELRNQLIRDQQAAATPPDAA